MDSSNPFGLTSADAPGIAFKRKDYPIAGVWRAIWAELHWRCGSKWARRAVPQRAVLDSQSIKSAH